MQPENGHPVGIRTPRVEKLAAVQAVFPDEDVRSLRAGKLADSIILPDSPLTVEPEAIKDLEAWMTMVGRRVEHGTLGHGALCTGW